MSRRDDDLEREIRLHLELEAAERMADGQSAADATRGATRVFGNVRRVREDAHDVWVPAWVQHVGQDLRYAWRLARRTPGFTAGAILMLALGIGASSTIFSALYAIVLSPLPFERPAELVRLAQVSPSRGIDTFPVSLPLYRSWRQASSSFSGLAAEKGGTVTVLGLGDPRQVPAMYATYDLLPLLGVHPIAGRGFRADEDISGGADVALMTERFWQSAFAGDPAAVGRSLAIDGRSYRLVGVVPDTIRLAGEADLLLPLVPHTEDRLGMSELEVYGRLAPGVSMDRASDDMARVARQLALTYPDDLNGWGVRLEPLASAIVGPRAPRVLYLLLGAVGALLLVACANLSGLLLVRAAARTREIAIRTAIGGGRGRIVRQLLTESLLLAVFGGACGLMLASAGVQVLRRVAADVPRIDRMSLDAWPLLFAVAVSAAAGVLAGLAPARQATRLDLQRGLKEGAASATRGAKSSPNALIVGQLAMSIVLLASAGLAIRALWRATTVDLGFTPGHIVTMRLAPRTNPEAFFASLLERLRARPDVAAVAVTSGAPMASGNTSLGVSPVGPAAIPPSTSVQADWRIVSDGYFSAMNTPFIAGRDVTPRDDADGAKIIIVNETLARRLWGDADPIGRQVDLGGGGGAPATVVGLVRDTRLHAPGALPLPTYYASAYRGIYFAMTLVIRSRADADQLVPAVRAEVGALDPTLPIFDVRTMDDLVDAQLSSERLVASLLTGFAVAAVLLAAVGIYSAMAYATGQRAREVALRLALGATRGDVIRPLMRDGATLVAIGIGCGIAIAFPLSRLTGTLVSGISPDDPVVFVGAIVVLGGAAMAACAVPAFRASRVDPVEALRRD